MADESKRNSSLLDQTIRSESYISGVKSDTDEIINSKLFSSDFKSRNSDQAFQRRLKSLETRLRKAESDRRRAYKMRLKEKDIEIRRLSILIKLDKLHHDVMLSEVVNEISKDNEEAGAKLRNSVSHQREISEELEYLVSIESAYLDLSERYKQCKGVIKTYKKNEEDLKEKIEEMRLALDGQANMNSTILEHRSHEILDKARLEIETTKKSYEAKTTVLEAQLKKAQLKVCSLEKELDLAKSYYQNLESIYDELVNKIGV